MNTNDLQALVRAAQQGDVDAQFQLASDYLARRQMQRANEWMSKAAAAGHEQAQYFCAASILAAPGKGSRLQEACDFLESLAANGNPEANFLLANQLFLGEGIVQDTNRARVCLELACRAELPAAWRLLAMLHTINHGKHEIITACMHKAAVMGDPFAQYAAARMLQQSDDSKSARDVSQQWLTSAAAGGVYLARKRLSERENQASSGNFQTHTDFSEEISVDQAMMFDDPVPREVTLNTLETKPTVAIAEDVLAKLECEYLVNFAYPALATSRAIDPSSGASVRDKVRTSSGMNFGLVFKDLVVGFIERTMAHAAGMKISHSEPLAVLNYHPGQEYKPHFDAFLPDDPGASQLLATGGQRTKTVLVYLNDDYEGGATDFPNRSLTVGPKTGKLLLMENCEPDGSPSQAGLHAGLPVTMGEKWLASMWLREQPFRGA